MGTELNLSSGDVSILTNRLGTWADIVACDDFTYSKGVRMPPSGMTKKLAYGTGIVSKDDKAIKRYINLDQDNELKFEILALEVVQSPECREGRVIVYRSPSMKKTCEI